MVGAAWHGAPAGATTSSAAQPSPSGVATVPTAPTTSTTSTAPATRTGDGAGDSIDVLRADADQVRAALADTAAKRSAAQAQLATVRAEAAAATAAATEAEAAEQAAAAKARRLDTEAKAAAVHAFVGSGRDVPLGMLVDDDTHDAAWEATVLRYQAEQLSDLLARQQAAHDQLKQQRRAREAAAAAAIEAEQRAVTQVDALIRLENDQIALIAGVDERLESALSEAAALAAIDEQAAATLASQEQDLASAAALSVSSPPAATPVAARPAVKAPTTTAPASTIPPGPSAPATTAPTPTTVPSGPTPSPAPVDTVNVGGFIVARSIGDQLGRMLAAAQGAGLSLGGSGYRDVNVQIDLRRQHCGTTDYDIWLKPASQCSPPTAIPGRSMHEKGLAIDLTCSGGLIRDRASPCFAWLAANAAGFGFYNLPSEPWHWSTNGN